MSALYVTRKASRKTNRAVSRRRLRLTSRALAAGGPLAHDGRG